VSDVLARIVADKRTHVAARRAQRPTALLERELKSSPPPRGFAAALRAADAQEHLALIAEIKRASPSRGLIRADFDPPALARAYATGGATCLSVLTDRPWFEGEDEHLRAARAAAPLPVLRKDFIVDPYQILETRALGADCVLLIMAALPDCLAAELDAAARELDMDVLVEVHDGTELDRALALGAGLIGINNRNLKTLDVDLTTTVELAPRVPADRLVVAESGLYGRADLLRMHEAGARAFLVGESLMAQADVAEATRRLLGLAAAA
jgi:indole-3-glycerol phosphate synthase